MSTSARSDGPIAIDCEIQIVSSSLSVSCVSGGIFWVDYYLKYMCEKLGICLAHFKGRKYRIVSVDSLETTEEELGPSGGRKAG
jgi:hypothetical protein